MSISTPFIERPIATVLLTAGIALAGMIAFFYLPVAPLPQVDYPTISVQASMPGASPETMATSVATPLERHLGQISDVTEMTSQSTLGNTRVTLQFGLDRNIDGAARDVQAGIAAARADLPAALKTNPTYRKVNPADAPIMLLALTSDTLPVGQIYDAASTILAQKLSQIQGVGQVNVGGGSLPAVRIDLNPRALFKYGIGLEDVRVAVAAANAHEPKGAVEDGDRQLQLYDNDQARTAADYKDLIVAWRNGAPVQLTDVGAVNDSVEDLRNQGLFNGQKSVVVIITKQPGANIVETVNGIKKVLPQLEASIPATIKTSVAMDRTTTIRASLSDVERTLCIAIGLVVLVVFLFLRNGRATLIPSVVVPVSLIGTFGAMYLLGYSLDNLSLMALTVATGFVVDDAIVVLENIARHIEAGMPRMQAALQGAREVGFTVLSMSISLIAVFAPILLMGGIVGRLFREFAITLSAAIVISLIVSLTTTPMMCSRLMQVENKHKEKKTGLRQRFYRQCECVFIRTQRAYDKALVWALHHEPWVLVIFFLTIAVNIHLYIAAPKGFFPQQDTGQLSGAVVADQSISFQLMQKKMVDLVNIVKEDPAVATVAAFTGGGQTNSGNLFVSLKPLAVRKISADQIIDRLRGKVSSIPGAPLFLQASQDIRMGGRSGAAQYQYSLQADSLEDLRTWAPKLTDELKKSPILTDVNSDQQDGGLEADVTVDRDAAARVGLTMGQIDNTLYDAFGQREVSVIYNALNQYHIVMEAAPSFWQNPETLNELYVEPELSTTSVNTLTMTTPPSAETMVPLSAVAKFTPGKTPLAVNHQGHFAASTISFNLAAGKSLSDATTAIQTAMNNLHVPSDIHGGFQGTAQVFQQSLSNEPIIIVAALAAVYIVLGILYESFVHPLTILSTLPSAGVGAMLAIKLWPQSWPKSFSLSAIGDYFVGWQGEFSIMSLIGIILLIGIVKKNAIMMIDVALIAAREKGFDSHAAIYHACLLRFRPIMMTTLAALFGALPLAIGFGEGSELRRPLGIAVVGGLAFSQMLTLFTTPVIYIYLDRLSPKKRDQRLVKRETVPPPATTHH